MHGIITRALEAYRRKRVLDGTNAAYATLRGDTIAWEEIRREREAWDVTLADGLEKE